MTIQEKLRDALTSLTVQNEANSVQVKHLSVDEEQQVVTLIIGLLSPTKEIEKQLSREVAKIVKLDFNFKGVKLQFEPLVITKDSDKKVNEPIYIAITSGKGGVGKSTVTANLAVAMSRLGYKVGIIDADIYGPSIPHLFEMEIDGFDVACDNKIIAPLAQNIPIISSAFFLEHNEPLMWRGPMLNRMLNHFFNDVTWDPEIEFMFIDLPPGTGDVAMDIQKLIPNAHVIVVTTPHLAASHIAIKSGYMAQKLNHQILGVIENMAYFTNPVNNEKEYIFGTGGATRVAKQLDTTLLASFPIIQPTQTLSIYDAKEEQGLLFLGLANKILKQTLR